MILYKLNNQKKIYNKNTGKSRKRKISKVYANIKISHIYLEEVFSEICVKIIETGNLVCFIF